VVKQARRRRRERGSRRRQLRDHGVGAVGGQVDALPLRGEARVGEVGRLDGPDCCDDVLRRQRLAIGPAGVRREHEPVCQPVAADAPGRGQVRHRLRPIVEAQERAIQEVADVTRGRVRTGQQRIERQRALGGDERLTVVRTGRRQREGGGRAGAAESDAADGDPSKGDQHPELDQPVAEPYWP
jgi:hypothetical protein